MNIKPITNIFNNENVKFYYNKKQIILDEYGNSNIKILDNILKNGEMLNSLLYIGDIEIYVILLIKIAIDIYLNNLIDEDNFIIKNIDIGDKVCVEGKIGKCIEKGNISDYGEGIKIEFKDKATNTILDKSIYKVLPYNGESDLSVMNSSVSTKKFITKEIIANLLYGENYKSEIKNFKGIIKKTCMIVVPNKGYIEALLSKIYIEFKNKSILFTEAFPCSYITSNQNIVNYPGNYTKQNSLFNFTTNIATAYEFVRENKDIQKVFIFGGEYINKEYSDLERIISRKSINQTILISEISDLNQMSEVITSKFIKEYENNMYTWTKNAILNIKINQNSIIDAYINKSCNTYIIENELLYEGFNKVKTLFFKLIKCPIEDKHKDRILRYGFSLLNTLETTPFSMDLLEYNIGNLGINIDSPAQMFKNLKKMGEDIICNIEIKTLIKDIISALKNLMETIRYKNYKWDYLLNNISKYGQRKHRLYKKNSLIIVRKQYESIILSEILKRRHIEIDVISIERYNIEKVYDEVYVLGYYNLDKNRLFYETHIKNIKFILYKSEIYRYNEAFKKYKNLECEIEQNNKIYDLLNCEISKYKSIISIDSDKYIDASNENVDMYDKKIEEYIENIEFKIDFLESLNPVHSEYKSMVEAKKIVISENDEYALLTQNYKARFIDWNKKIILKKEINNINKDDELLFLNEYLDEDSEIISYIIEDLIEKNSLNEIIDSEISMSEDYKWTKYWKRKLSEYKEKNNLTLEDISKSLKIYGQNIHQVTIGSWINNKRIIGPREKDVYIAISKLIMDDCMQNNIENIYQASKRIRKLHSKIKKQIDLIIVKNFFGEKQQVDNINKIIEEKIGDINKYIKVIKVREIKNFNIKIPIYLSNKLLDTDTIY